MAASEANGRTFNAEIVARLVWAFEHAGDKTDARLETLEQDVAEMKDIMMRMLVEKMQDEE